MGPMLSWKGVDNATYYRLMQDDAQFYMDYTGTGNSLNVRNPQVLKMIMDSLRYWVTHMHVDGFRFDLAATLARELHDVSKLSSFFDTIHQDPTLAEVKLIAEPWDVGRADTRTEPVPGFVGGVEWLISRHGAQVLEGRCGAALRFRLPPDGVKRSLPVRRAQAVCEHQLRHCA